jgi:hypothetical protein
MKLVNWTALLAVATLTLAPVAYAADARLTDCITMAKQVSAALSSAQTGTTTDEAKTQAAAGRSYCASQMYAQGVAHYSRALQLLGKG